MPAREISSAPGPPGPAEGGDSGRAAREAELELPVPRSTTSPSCGPPGTLARTTPWQLDPDRRPQGYTTDLVLTSRSMLFLGTRTGTLGKADVLAEYPRESLAAARRMRFSEVEADVRLTFADGSWMRLFTGNPDSAVRLAELLDGAAGALAESGLTPGRRDRVTRFLADLPADARPPPSDACRAASSWPSPVSR
jgi:hypothetical protein